MAGPVQRIKQFFDETKQEVQKTTWPSRQELVESSLVVIISLLLFAGFVWLVDMGLNFAVKYIVDFSS